MRAVLTLGTPSFATAEFEALKREVEVVSVPATTHDETARAIRAAVDDRAKRGLSEFEACVWFFGNGPWAPFNENLLGSLKSCRFYSGGGVGYDDADIEWMARTKAIYANTPTAVTASTASGALMLILMATRAASWAESNVRRGWWRGENQPDQSRYLPLGSDVEGLKLGIVGMGNIGKQLALRASACGMSIFYSNRNRVEDAEKYSATFLPLDELLATCDVISLNCPLTESTRGLIGRDAFAKMKDGVFLVNTARGPVVDEEALVEAIRSGKVSRAGLDVFEREPVVHAALLDSDISHRVTIQPHSAARTEQTIHKGEQEILSSLDEFLRGLTPRNAVNAHLME